MNYGTPTNLGGILDALDKRIARDRFRVVVSLYADDDHMQHPTTETFVVIRAGRFTSSSAMAQGVGKKLLLMTGTISASLLTRTQAERELSNPDLLKGKVNAALGHFNRLLSLLHMHQPTSDAQKTDCLLMEPMRLQTADLTPRRRSDASAWASLVSTWEIKFRQELPS